MTVGIHGRRHAPAPTRCVPFISFIPARVPRKLSFPGTVDTHHGVWSAGRFFAHRIPLCPPAGFVGCILTGRSAPYVSEPVSLPRTLSNAALCICTSARCDLREAECASLLTSSLRTGATGSCILGSQSLSSVTISFHRSHRRSIVLTDCSTLLFPLSSSPCSRQCIALRMCLWDAFVPNTDSCVFFATLYRTIQLYKRTIIGEALSLIAVIMRDGE